MRHLTLICIGLVALAVLIDAKAVPAAQKSAADAAKEVANGPLGGTRIGKGIKQIVSGSLKGAKDITGGATGGGTGGILSGIGRIVRGALTGAGNIVGGALGGGR